MTGFLFSRLGRALLTVWGVMTVAFLLIRLNGNPGALMVGADATPQDVARINDSLGFDRPLTVQYGHFLDQVIHGNLGDSLRLGGPALKLVLDRMPATIELALTGFAIGTAAALAAAIAVQLSGSRGLRVVLVWIGTVRQAIPTFVFGVLMILTFSVTLHWFPSIGRGGPAHLVLPAVTVGTFEFTLYLRLLDAAFNEQAGADYVRTAYAKGQSRFGVLIGHLLPNALLPILTVAGLNLGGLLGGAVIIETVFNWPGAGQLIIQSVSARDFPVVQAGLLVVCVAFIGVNLVTDVVSVVVDPRVRTS